MSDEQDILSLDDEASSGFDGFTASDVGQAQYHLRVRDVPAVEKSKDRSKPDKSKPDKPKGKADKNKGKTKKKRTIDISKLSEQEINNLRERMGFAPNEVVNPQPDLTDNLDDSGIVDPDWPQCAQETLQDPSLLPDPAAEDWFDEPMEWELPKLKAPERGEAVRDSLANMLNLAFSAQCSTEEVVKKYKIPSNCDKMAPPMVNAEVWGEVSKKAHTDDRAVRDIQGLITAGVLPILKLAGEAKGNKATRTCLQDALLLLGQAQFALSIRRRYLLRPHIKRTYAKLCSYNTPVTTLLFGDDISKEMKRCESSIRVSREASWGPVRGRGFARRVRFNPYPQTYGSQPPRRGFPPYRGQFRGRPRGRGKPSFAAGTPTPNDQ